MKFQELTVTDLLKALKTRELLVTLAYLLVPVLLLLAWVLPAAADNLIALGAMRDVRSRIETAQMHIGQLERLRKDKADYTAQIAQLEERFFTPADLPNIAGYISQVAKAAGAKLLSSAPAPLDKEVFTRIDDRFHISLIQFELISDYHAFGRFMNALESHEKQFQIEQFAIQASDATPDAHTIGLVVAAFARQMREEAPSS